MKGTVRLAFLCASTLLTIALLAGTAPGQPATPAEEKVGRAEIESILRTLEDPKELETLKANLRALLTAQEAATPHPSKAQPSPITRKTTKGILKIEKALGRLPTVTMSTLHHVGDHIRNFVVKLAEPEYRRGAFTVIVKLAVSLAAAIFIFMVLRLLLRRFQGRISGVSAPWYRKLALAALNIIADIAPAMAVYVFALVFVPWTRIPPPYPQAIFMFIDFLILYSILLGILRALVSPADSAMRLCPVEEGMAATLLRRGRQLLRFAIFGYLPVSLFRLLAPKTAAAAAFATFYKIVWIVIVAMALSRWRWVIIHRLHVPEKWEGPPKSPKQRATRIYNRIARRLYWVLLAYVTSLALLTLLGYHHIFTRLLQYTITTIVLAGLGYGAQHLVTMAFGHAYRAEERLRKRYPELGHRGSKYLRLLNGLTLLVIWAMAIALILEACGVGALQALSRGAGGAVLQRAVLIAIIVAIAVLFITIFTSVIERLMRPRPDPVTGRVPELSQQRRTLLPLLDRVVKYATLVVAGLVILDQIGINPAPILAGVGIVGLAVGFGAQTLVKDIISGFFILFENQVRVGDVVVIGDKGGLVEAMNLRTLVLRDLAGNVHIIPCGSIDKVMNMTKDFSRYVLDLGVSYREDVDEVMRVVKEIADEMMRDPDFGPDIIEPLEILGVDDFADSQITIKMRIATKPIKQWRVGRELRRRIKRRFDELGIEIPFPHRTIYMGEPKKGTPPPPYLKMAQDMEKAFAGGDENADRVEEGKEKGP